LPSTARLLGFAGSNAELAVPETNIHLGVTYLAQAWRPVGGGSHGYDGRDGDTCRRPGPAEAARDHDHGRLPPPDTSQKPCTDADHSIGCLNQQMSEFRPLRGAVPPAAADLQQQLGPALTGCRWNVMRSG
jgi:hypothetical protein